VVWTLIALNVLAFGAEWTSADPGTFIDAFAAVPYDITHGIVLPPPSPPAALLTILTSMFVHAGVAHVGVNLLVLAAFGPAVEARCGHARFAAFYLLCGIAGELAQISIGPGSHVPAVGASGAIAGVLGAYLMTFPLQWPAVLGIGAWAATQFVAGLGRIALPGAGEQAGIASFVHIGGFCCGVLLIGRFRRPDAGMRASPW
jgi:membrane associated rhomboid family serine protease